MTNDYDIVIIGGSLAAHHAALTATQLGAIVALVEPKPNYGIIHHHAIREVGKLAKQFRDRFNFGIYSSQVNTSQNSDLNGTKHTSAKISEQLSTSVAWTEALLYARGVVINLTELNSTANLAALGVDVILGRGEFSSSSPLAFTVNNRLLRARTYLLASGSSPLIPNIEGLSATGYLTLSNIWQFFHEKKLPENWVIIGGVPQSIEIAQTLSQLGCSVTLILSHPSILSYIDSEIAQLLLAQLEVDGVRVLTQKPVTQVRRIENKKWVQVGDKAIEADEILVATKQQPNLESLNLETVGVKWNHQRLVVNDKLQTTNERIYACGDVIGGFDFANIGNYEAKIAIKNALFFSKLSVNYCCIPWGISSQPMLAQVGLTEIQAKRQYHENQVLVLRQYFKSVTLAQIQGEITGICKLIVLENGEILGAAIFGAAAGELINLIALAMSQKISVQQLANLSPIYPSFSEILEQTAQEWHKQKLNKNTALQDFLAGFFHFRRDWNW
jgi:pyruvate/2-oxoglutarate dehydrogenase complex dihydrolipoamide dehydrogenase (E3) component